MKNLELEQMENIEGSGWFSRRNVGCGSYGLAAGIASGFNPIVGGLTTLACFALTT